ncbi:MAG: hypothetical protein HDQ97_02805 [Lachnospiraceae bacterium]|nr:hypothetical protein [Lachnospiraceae bacterium]
MFCHLRKEKKVRITKDYVLQNASDGTVSMVQLQKVEKIVMNVREYTAKTRGEGLKILQASTVYPMYFYCRKSEKEKTKEYDREISFGKREDRKLVAYYLHEMKIGNED